MIKTHRINRYPVKHLVAALVAATGVNAEIHAFEIEEVIVTAQKRSESTQEIPVAISAFTAEGMENMKMETANDIAAGVPNLQVSLPFGETQPIFSIRGQSMSDYNVNQSSPVGVYVDESYLGASFLQGIALFDLERVEVLRGPQGTLYGKNTTGGAINFISRGPSFEGTQGNITLTLGDYGREHVNGAVETELVEEKLAVRAAYTYTETDGHHKNHFPGEHDLASIDTWSGRLTLRYEGDSLDATLRYTAGESDGIASAPVSEGRIPTLIGNTDAVGALLGQTPRQGDWDAWEGSHNKSEPYSTDFDNVMLTVNWSLEDYTLTAITTYLEGQGLNQANTDGAPWRMLEIDWGSEVRQIAQDLRIASDFDGAFNFIAGVYYAKDVTDVSNAMEFFHLTDDLGIAFDAANTVLTDPAGTGVTLLQDYTQKRESVALYFHSTYDLTDALALTTGLRYTEDKGNSKDFHTQLGDYERNPVGDMILPGSFADASAEFDDSEVTGKLGLDYQIHDDLMVYASYSRGYRSSALNGGAMFSPTEMVVADPETVDAYELGFKSALQEGRLQLNGALFYYDYSDQQFVNFFGVQQLLVNGESSTIQGLELELVARVTESLTLNAGLGYLDTEFEELALTDTVNGGDIDLGGNELFNAPELNVNLALDYVIADSDYGVFRASASTVYTGEQWFSAYNDKIGYDQIKSDSSWLSNAKLSWDSADDKLSAALWVKNIENSDAAVYAVNAQSGFGYDYYTIGLPRRLGVDLSYRF